MGMLDGGKWNQASFKTDDTGRFIRNVTSFRDRVTADGSSGFGVEPGRYHLYVSLACPWAHRTLIMRKLKRLEEAISLSVVDFHMGADGWYFSSNPGSTADTVNGRKYLREIYLLARSDFTGRITVPVLWDRKERTIVNNESAEILRMFDCEFDQLGEPSVTYYPEGLRESVDETIQANYEPINNGVYRAGFATTQEAYEEAVGGLFTALDRCEEVLGRQRYLCGGRLTEADWCLFTTLIRFDMVYYGHFKCNLRRIIDYPNLWDYLRELYQTPGVAKTCNFDHIKGHYYGSHETVNPNGIIPKGPIMDFNQPHSRAAM